MTSANKGRLRCLWSLLALIAAMTIGSGCDESKSNNGGGGSDNPSHNDKDNNNDPGNVDATFNMAVDFASGKKSIEQLKELYDRLNETQRRELADKDSDGKKFTTLIVSGFYDEKANEILHHFIRNLDPSKAIVQVESKTQGMSAFDIMRRNGRPSGERTQDVNKGIAILLNQKPKLVNDLTDVNNRFEFAKFNGVLTESTKLDPNNTNEIIKELSLANFDSWLGWAVGARKDAKVAFFAFYEKGDEARKSQMRNEMLAAAMSQGGEELKKFVNDSDELGLSSGFATDSYKLRNLLNNGDVEGPILYVVGKRAAEEQDTHNPRLNVIDIKPLATKVKSLMRGEYANHITVSTYGEEPGQTIEGALNTIGGISPTEVKVALDLDIGSDEIIAEVKRIANKTTYNERKVSPLLEEMFQSYANADTTANLDTLANYTVVGGDIVTEENATGVLVVGDKLIHVLSRLKTNERLFNVIKLLTDGVTNPAALVADNGAGSSALKLLCNHERNGHATGDRNQDIIATLVNKGVAADITKIHSNDDMAILLEAIEEDASIEDLTKIIAGAHDAVFEQVIKFAVNNHERTMRAFGAAYATLTEPRRAKFHNGLLLHAFGESADVVESLVMNATAWGIKDGFAAESYELNSGGDGIYKGKFSYVLAMRMYEEINGDADGYTLERMHKIFGEIKSIMQANYTAHVNVEQFLASDGTTQETIFAGLKRLHLSDERIKYALSLTDEIMLSEKDVVREATAIAEAGAKSDTTILRWLYQTAITTDGKAAALKIPFVMALAKLEVTAHTNAMFVDVLSRVESLRQGKAASLVAKNINGMTALMTLADNDREVADESLVERQKMMLKLIQVGGPRVIADIVDYDALANVLNAVRSGNNPQDMLTYYQGINPDLMPNTLLFVEQDFTVRGPVFKAAYAAATGIYKTNMASALLSRAYARGQQGLNRLIDNAEAWGLLTGFGGDIYNLRGNQGRHYKGSFHYVVAKRIVDDIFRNVNGFDLANLHEVSGKMKAILGPNYVNHVTVALNGPENRQETVFAGLQALGVDEPRIKYALQLDAAVTVNDVFAEGLRLTGVPTDTTAELRWLYENKIKLPADARALADATNVGNRFTHLLAYMKATAGINAVLADFLDKVELHQVGAKVTLLNAQNEAGNTALMIVSADDRRIENEDASERQAMILALSNPVENVISSAGNLANILNAMVRTNPTGCPAIMKTVPKRFMTNLLQWVDQNAGVRKPLFKAAYAQALGEHRVNMASALLARAYEGGNDGLNRLIDTADDWGLRDGFATDVYEHNGEVGSFLYVVAKTMGESIHNNRGQFTLEQLHGISGKMKIILGDSYVNHTTVAEYSNNETILAGLAGIGLPEQHRKYALQLDALVTVDNVFDESIRLAINSPTGNTIELRWLYNAKIQSPLSANQLSQKQTGHGNHFTHNLVRMKATADTNDMLADFLGKVSAYHDGDAVALLKAKNDDKRGNKVALEFLVANNRNIQGEDVAQRQIMITKLVNIGDKEHIRAIKGTNDMLLVLNAVLAKGKTADVARAFTGVRRTMIAGVDGFAKWAYDNRASVISDSATTHQTIPTLFAAEHDNRSVLKQELWHNALIEIALQSHGIGDDNKGLVSVIKMGFLSKEALKGNYELFNMEEADTILASALRVAATASLASAIPISLSNELKWVRAREVLTAVLFGTSDGTIINTHGANIANPVLMMLPRAIKQTEVVGLAQALKAKLGSDDWNTMCKKESNNVLPWHIVNVTATNKEWGNDTTAKTVQWLDYN